MYRFKKGMYWMEAELCTERNESKSKTVQLMERKRMDKIAVTLQNVIMNSGITVMEFIAAHDIHICPLCKKPQTKLLDTWLCSDCNYITIWDLVYDYKEYRRLMHKAESRK